MLTSKMPGPFEVGKRFAGSQMHLNMRIPMSLATLSKVSSGSNLQMLQAPHCPIIPGLPDDLAKLCLALVPRTDFPVMGSVSKVWRSFIQSKEFLVIRKEVGKVEEWVYILTDDEKGRMSNWEVLVGCGEKVNVIPPMPGSAKAGFGVVVMDAKLFIMAGYLADMGTECVSDEVYQYDSCLNSWTMLGKMNFARHDFACAEIDGIIYAAGGFGENGNSLSSVEMYNPEKNEWTLIESLRRPRWGCFGCSFGGKLYVMGGRSTFTIGNSRSVDVYSPEHHSWNEMKSGCVMVTAQAVLENKLFCMEWKNQRKLAIFNPADNSWLKVPVPITGSSTVGFRFGIYGGKLLLFALKEEPGYQTLLYDPDAPAGSEWRTSSIKPSGSCLFSVTIKV